MKQIHLAWNGSISSPTMIGFLDIDQAGEFSNASKKPIKILETRFNDIPGKDYIPKDGGASPGRRKIFIFVFFGRVVECSNSLKEVGKSAAGSQGKGDVFAVDLIEAPSASEGIDGTAEYVSSFGRGSLESVLGAKWLPYYSD
jgi:hypothetical protein